MTQDEAKDILLRIASAYPNFDLTEPEMRVQVWTEHLQKMPYDRVRQNLDRHIADKSFPPAIAEIAVRDDKREQTKAFFDQLKEWERQADADRKRRTGKR